MRKLYKTLGRLSLLAAGLLTASAAYAAAGNGAVYTGAVTTTCSNAYLETESDANRGNINLTINYSVTWQEDGNLLVTLISLDPNNIMGMTPQLAYNGVSPFTDNKVTLTGSFNENDNVSFNFYMAYNGGLAESTVNYTVGSTNSTGGGDDSGNTGGGNTGGDQTGEGNGATYTGTANATFSNAYLDTQTEADRTDISVTVDYSVTWQEDGSLLIKFISIDPSNIVGQVSPQIDYSGIKDMTSNSYTLTGDFKEGDTVNFGFYIPYNGGAGNVQISYTVGSTNSTGGGDDSGNTGGDEGDGGDNGDDKGDDVTGEPGATYSGKPVEGTIVGGDYEGQKVTVAWTATWNEDQTVTFTITVNPSNLAGLVPQLFIDNAHAGNFESANGEWTYTTTQKYEAGDTPTLAFYITVANGATEQIPFDYTVGAEGNDSGSSTPPGTTPDDENTDSNVGNGATATGSVKGIFENAQLPGDETVMDIDYTLEWTGTWNEDGTVTITLDINPWVVGLVPQLNVNGVYYDDFKMVNDDNTKYTITTTDTYKEGTTPFSLYMPYTGGTDTILLDYEVGASGDSTGVQNIGNALRNDGVYYDLSGRPVANPKHGIFIINGKKVVIR